MTARLLPVVVGTQTRVRTTCERVVHECRRAWLERHDESGLDEAVTKMIWLAVGIVVALAATAFFVSTFNKAKDSVPDPVAP